MQPTFFTNQAYFREWLHKNHNIEKELLVGFYKISTGRESMTWSQSVDQALCYGWIDGVRKSSGPDSYTIRFTPRKSRSTWSAINIKKIEELKESGLLMPAGLAAYEKRTESNSRIYSHERKDNPASLPPEMEAEFKANKTAWEFFIKQAPSYQKTMLHIITSAKQEKTQQSRFEKLVHASTEGRRIS